MILLFALAIVNDFLTIDLGTEYYKAAKANFKGDPVIINTEGIGVSVPNAIACKSSKPIQLPITNESIEDIDIKFDRQALSILKKNASLGFQFIPRLIARSNTNKLNTTNLITSFQAFSLSFAHLIERLSITGPISIVIPHYWTPEQRYVISTVCHFYRIPLSFLLEDNDVIGVQYSATRAHRFKDSRGISDARNVLFVDIGGTTSKAYGFHFYIDGDKAVASENSYFWSENVGGYWFRKALSDNLNISLKKAEKLLQSESDINKVVKNIQNVTNGLFNLIKRAADRANDLSSISNGSAIQEVQIIGGASKYPFILDIVKSATNCSNIKRELNPNEAIALGGVYFSLQSSDSSKFTPSFVYKRPPSNITLQCQKQNDYCIRGSKCNRIIYEYESKGCDHVLLYSDDASTPEGLSPIISTTNLVNISNITYEEGESGYGKFEMSPSSLSIQSIEWCKSKDGYYDSSNVCYPIKFKKNYGFEKEYREQAKLVIEYWRIEKKRQEKSKILVQINDLMIRLDSFFSKLEKGKVEAAVHVTDQQKETYNDLSTKYYKGKMSSLSYEYLNQTYYEIKNLAKSLKMRLSDENNDEL